MYNNFFFNTIGIFMFLFVLQNEVEQISTNITDTKPYQNLKHHPSGRIKVRLILLFYVVLCTNM